VPQDPTQRATESTNDNQSCQRMLLHRSADGLSALAIEALGLWQIAPSLLHVCLATPVDVTSEAGGLSRLLRGAARLLPKPLPNPSLGGTGTAFKASGSHSAATLFEADVVQAGGSLAGKVSSTASSTCRCWFGLGSLSACAGRF
jgi:hypothetical protein